MLNSNPIVFTSNQLFKSYEAFLEANLKALEYKEICIVFETAAQTLELSKNTLPETLAKAITMRDKANERYENFIIANGLVMCNAIS